MVDTELIKALVQGGTPLLITAASFSPAAKSLVEKVCSAVGIIAEPWRFKRLERVKTKIESERASTLNTLPALKQGIGQPAENWLSQHIDISQEEALAIQEATGYTLSPLQKRGLMRLAIEEGRRQENMENVLLLAAAGVKEDANPNNLDDDWLARHLEAARLYSNEKVQRLWAAMLSGEANNPGTYSLRAIETLKTLNQNDLIQFEDLCQYSILLGNRRVIFILANWVKGGSSLALDGSQLIQENLLRLDEVGLISFNPLSPFALKYPPEVNTMLCRHCEKKFVIHLKESSSPNIEFGSCRLTQTGQELSNLCNYSPKDEFYLKVIAKLKTDGYVLYSENGERL